MQNTLTAGFTQMNIPHTQSQIDQFIKYYNTLIDYNTKVNLTSITQPNEVCIKHFLDSASLLCFLDIPKGAKVIDVGSGAGFPGLPLKILRPDIRLTLLDSLNKRVAFLRLCTSELGLDDVECLHSRAEDAAQKPQYREKFDVVTSRAVANMATLSEYCLPYATVGGSFAAFKGPSLAGGELEGAHKAILLMGGGNIHTTNAEIPGSNLSHCIVLVDKIGKTPTQYPRGGGKPTSKAIR